MSLPFWNLGFQPPKNAEYTQEEIYHEFVSSAKGYHVCQKDANEFYNCRKKPLGKVVEPERCLNFATKVYECFQQVRKVHPECQMVYSELINCMANRNSNCSLKLNDYIECGTMIEMTEIDLKANLQSDNT
ncbi:hypothetical protein SteCoe_974 [Stentor coeruleus]|uniref:IMS import disulfide relay-system CHCH-CHCH-like Cx9C domain-containing protein n=1 Tax=Stentor coeruleus TaxID=5963 RepID=A0A1R2D2T8_9CILI|nr:hypothetical protein SteCoe_974 [Stentor coeruleus]